MDETAIKQVKTSSNITFSTALLLTFCFSTSVGLLFAGYKYFNPSAESVRTDKFTAEVIGVWWNDGIVNANYFTLRFPNEEVKDIQVTTGLRFAGKRGDAVFGTVSNGKYTVEGIRRKPWNDDKTENAKKVFDVIKKAL
jgi:hypothetical protein